jgi:hypothetical protein
MDLRDVWFCASGIAFRGLTLLMTFSVAFCVARAVARGNLVILDKLALQSAFARTALPQSQAAYAGA